MPLGPVGGGVLPCRRVPVACIRSVQPGTIYCPSHGPSIYILSGGILRDPAPPSPFRRNSRIGAGLRQTAGAVCPCQRVHSLTVRQSRCRAPCREIHSARYQLLRPRDARMQPSRQGSQKNSTRDCRGNRSGAVSIPRAGFVTPANAFPVRPIRRHGSIGRAIRRHRTGPCASV